MIDNHYHEVVGIQDAFGKTLKTNDVVVFPHRDRLLKGEVYYPLYQKTEQQYGAFIDTEMFEDDDGISAFKYSSDLVKVD